MITAAINFVVLAITEIIAATGYAGVFLLMLFESCGIPAPSEVIMPFAGFLAAAGKLGFAGVVASGTLGNLCGSCLAYYIGLKGGRPLIEKYGRYIFLSRHDLDKADFWFKKYGEPTVLIGRLLPVVRTYISFPAGVGKMNFKKFCVFTLLGALPWSALFAWLGIKLQSHWDIIRQRLHDFDLAMAILLVLAVVWFIWKHARRRRRPN